MGELERTLSGPEYSEWLLFYRDDPFGEFRADLRAGIIAQTVASAFGGSRKRPIDFMPIVRRQQQDEAELTEREIATRFNAMMFSLSGKTGVKIGKRKG